jgi:hypothetical protein
MESPSRILPKSLIIVPTLGNRPEYIHACLNSLVNQSVKPKIIVAHPEKSLEGIREVIADFPGVDFVAIEGTQVEVINQIAYRNQEYKYMNWLGDDDLLPKHSIEFSQNYLEVNEKIGGTFGRVTYINSEGIPVGSYLPPRLAQALVCIIPAVIKLEAGLFRMSNFIKLGGLDEKLKYAPDVYITINLRRYGKWRRINQDLCHFRIHQSSLTAAMPMMGLKESAKIQMQYGNIIEKFCNILVRHPFRIVKLIVFAYISREKAKKSSEQR